MNGGTAAPGRLLHATTSLCARCRNAVPAQVHARDDGEVWMHKSCEEHGAQAVRLSTSAAWYERTRATPSRKVPPRRAARPVEHGCPFDCGACPSHEQKVRMPVVTITSACNLECPICYVRNKNENAYHMTRPDFERLLSHLREDHGDAIDLVNFTGGEPTLHPHFLEFLELSRAAGIHRVSFCTNGIRLASDEALVARLAELGARVALSFDTFEAGADVALQGARLLDTKLRCLELLERHRVDTTLIPVMTRGVNDHEIGRIIALGLSLPNVRHVEVHTMTFTGQGGTTFDRAGRISTYEVLELIAQTTDGLLGTEDWVSSPCAHPLCYQVAYLLDDPAGGRPVPFTRFMSPGTLYDCLADRLYLEPSPKLDAALQDAIGRLWAEEGGEAERILGILRRLLDALFPAGKPLSRADALAASERASKAIYVHSHMDEETFDTERLMQCCDSDVFPDGTTIPVCAHGVLYRDKEPQFMTAPAAWNERRGGVKPSA